MARRKTANEFPVCPVAGVTSFISTALADSDPLSTIVVPSDGTVGHSAVQGVTNGTGTALITMAWYSAAARGGTVLSTSHLDSAGAVYNLDGAAGVVYSASNGSSGGQQLAVAEGGRLFLNCDFDGGTATVASTFGVGLTLIL